MKQPRIVRNVRRADPRQFEHSGVAAKLQAALAVLTGPHRTCPHITSLASPRTICAQHPAAGVMCDVCQMRHIKGHSDDDELRCDACGHLAPGGLLTPLGAAWGSVVVSSLGVCRRCREAA